MTVRTTSRALCPSCPSCSKPRPPKVPRSYWPASERASGSCGPRWAACCASPRASTLDRDDINYEAPDDETMILNLGPPTPPLTGS